MFASLLAALPRYLQLKRSQYWSAERLAAYRRVRLEKTLRAAAAIPFYARRFGAMAGADDLAAFPILRRHDLDDLNRSVREANPHRASFEFAQSSGTTGHKVEVLFDAAHQSGRFAARARYLIDNGWSPLRRTGWIIEMIPEASPDSRLTRSRLLPGVKFFSHTRDFAAQLRWLRELDPHFIYALPSVLEGLAWVFAKENVSLPSLRKIFTGGEVLEARLRERVRTVFGVDVADNYGSTEMFLAWQCPRGGYHVNAEHVTIEIVDDDGREVPSGTIGRVIATTLENELMPLIRYDMGDYAIAMEDKCSCGRTLPLIGDIIGRSVNLFRRRNGELLSPWQLGEALDKLPAVRQLQMVQRGFDQFAVRFVADEPFAPSLETSIRAHFSKIIGEPVTVSFERVREITRSKSGKFMAALCELPSEKEQAT